MRVGLFFGTFNPIHVGHLIIANHMTSMNELDQVWLIVTPQNPLKQKNTLLADHHRLAMVRLAIDDNEQLRVSDVEFKLPKPNYTMLTLAHLQEKHPTYSFSLILGEDNLTNFHKWYNYEQILNNHQLIVYPRADQSTSVEKIDEWVAQHPNVLRCNDVPLMKISSTFVRKQLKDKKSVRYVLTEPVYRYIDEMNFYK